MENRKKCISADTTGYVGDAESVKMNARAPLCELLNQQINTLRVCNETANVILRIITDEEALITNDEPKCALDDAAAVLSGLENLHNILQKIQKALA